jgi:uncharacterized protein YhaN
MDISRADMRQFTKLLEKMIEKLDKIADNMEKITVDRLLDEMFLRVEGEHFNILDYFEGIKDAQSSKQVEIDLESAEE